jgi:hypothetical protein
MLLYTAWPGLVWAAKSASLIMVEGCSGNGIATVLLDVAVALLHHLIHYVLRSLTSTGGSPFIRFKAFKT